MVAVKRTLWPWSIVSLVSVNPVVLAFAQHTQHDTAGTAPPSPLAQVGMLFAGS